jgi:hypothetical protein
MSIRKKYDSPSIKESKINKVNNLIRLLFLKILRPLKNANNDITIISILMEYDNVDNKVNCFSLNFKIKSSKITSDSFLTFELW